MPCAGIHSDDAPDDQLCPNRGGYDDTLSVENAGSADLADTAEANGTSPGGEASAGSGAGGESDETGISENTDDTALSSGDNDKTQQTLQNSSNTNGTDCLAGDAADKVYEDSDLERPVQDASEDKALTAEESQAALDRVKENLAELSGSEGIADADAGAPEDESGEDGTDDEDAGDAAENTADVSWYTAEGTSFTLKTAAQLKGLALLTANGESFQGKTVILGNDIDMTGVEWTLPIGNTKAHPFCGTFDGAGYVISHFTLGTEEAPASFDYSGFFGYLEGSVSDLKLQGSIYAVKNNGTLYTGGLAGYAAGAEICGVVIDVDITAAASSDIIYAGGLFGVSKNTAIDRSEAQGGLEIDGAESNRTYVGGVAGSAENGSGGKGGMINSGSTGTLQVKGGTVFAGGFVGYAAGTAGSRLTICNDYRNGEVSGRTGDAGVKVTADSGYAGGLAGYMSAYTELQNCYTSEKLDADIAEQSKADNSIFDGLPAGGSDSADRSFSTVGLIAGGVYGDASSEAAGVVKSCYAVAPEGVTSLNPQSADGTDGEESASAVLVGQTGGGAIVSGNEVFDRDGVFSEDSAISYYGTLYHALNMWAETDGAAYGADYWSGSGARLKPDPAAESAAAAAVALLMEDEEVIFEDTSWFDGAESEYTLTTGNQLRGLAKLVNNGRDFSGVTIKLGADVQITGDWTPIGAYASAAASRKPFSGIFDGQGYTITFGSKEADDGSSLDGGAAADGGTNGDAADSIEPAVITVTSDKGAGLFGYADSAELKNVTLDGLLRIDFSSTTTGIGTLAGYISNTQAEEITSDADLNYTQTTSFYGVYYGGIAGYASGTAGNAAVLKNCIHTGTIAQISNQSIGGGYIGGILGYAGDICCEVSNCVNSGDITFIQTSYSTTGGIAGRCGIVKNCVNFGRIKNLYGTRGSIGGSMVSSGSVMENCYGYVGDDTDITAVLGSGSGTKTSLGTFTSADGELTASNSTTLTYIPEDGQLEDGCTPVSYALSEYVKAYAGNGFRQWEADKNIWTPTGDILKGAAETTVTVEKTVEPAGGGSPKEDGSADVGDTVRLTADIAFLEDPLRERGTLSFRWYVSAIADKSMAEEVTDDQGNPVTTQTLTIVPEKKVSSYYYIEVTHTLGASKTVSESELCQVLINKAEGDTSWYPGETESWTKGSGTQEDPYQIETAAQLAYIAEVVNSGDATYRQKYFKLMNDIQLNSSESWTPIGGMNTAQFSGTFDGDGHTVSDLNVLAAEGNIYAGLFGRISGGTIKNLKVEGKITAKTKTNGAVCYAGGIVAYAEKSSVLSGLTAEIDIDAAVANTSKIYCYAGGIAGYLSGSSITECLSSGSVNAEGEGSYSYSYGGGITGYLSESSAEDCENNATVAAEAQSPYVGGISGYADGASTRISQCRNFGAVTNNGGYAGGITSYIYSASSVIVSCANFGPVVNLSQSSDTGSGGICGYAANTDEVIANCVNTGSISGYYAGGILGYANKTVSCSDLINTGAIDGYSYAGQAAAAAGSNNYVTVQNFYYNADADVTEILGYRTLNGSTSDIGTFDSADKNNREASITAAEGYTVSEANLGRALDTWIYENPDVGARFWEASERYGILMPSGLEFTGIALPEITLSQISETGNYALNTSAELSAEITVPENPLAESVKLKYDWYITSEETMDYGAVLEDGAGSWETAETGTATKVYKVDSTQPSLNYYYLKISVEVVYPGGVTLTREVYSDLKRVYIQPEEGDDAYYGLPSDSLEGEGTEESPYIVGSAGDLKRMQLMVNASAEDASAYYRLTNDIDFNGMQWLPMGKNSIQFKGVFDGGGHKIENLKISSNGVYSGFFGYINGAEIRNVSLEGSLTSGTGSGSYLYTGGAAAYAVSSKITNVTCDIRMSVVSDIHYTLVVGGVAGFSTGTDLSKSRNDGDIDITHGYSTSAGYLYAGGIVGQNAASVTSCTNTGNIRVSHEGSQSENAYVSGIVGGGTASEIINSANTGSITMPESMSGTVYVCGIAYAKVAQSATLTVDNCVNYGSISGTGNKYSGTYISVEQGWGPMGGSGTANISNLYLVRSASEGENFTGGSSNASYKSVGILTDGIGQLTQHSTYALNYVRSDSDAAYDSDLSYAVDMWINDNASSLPNTWTKEDGKLLPVGAAIEDADEPVISEISVSTDEMNPDRVFGKGTENGPVLTAVLTNEEDCGDLSWQWYRTLKKDDISVAELIEGADQASYTPDMNLTGFTQYYVQVTNQEGLVQKSTVSDLIGIMVNDPDSNAWSGVTATSFAADENGVYGDGTAERPFLIATGEQLAYMCELINGGQSFTNDAEEAVNYADCAYKLISDIDLGGRYWSPIGQSAAAGSFFEGTLDGNGKTISGLKLGESATSGTKYLGLFGYTSADISDLTLKNASADISAQGTMTLYSGNVAGYLASEGSLQNINVINEEESGSKISYHFIAGASSSSGMGSSSTSAATVWIGGIAGDIAANTTIDSCASACDIEAEGTAATLRIGGISNTEGNGAVISDCTNTGDLDIGVDVLGSSIYQYAAAGIAGYSQYPSISGCTSEGSIHVSGSKKYYMYIGGILGYSNANTAATSAAAVLEGCVNRSTIVSEMEAENASYVAYTGGIAAIYHGTISDCRNEGNIVVKHSGLGAGEYTGGIAGYAGYTGCYIYNCANTGGVSVHNSSAAKFTAYIGGALGYLNNGVVYNCFNSGDVAIGSNLQATCSIAKFIGQTNNKAVGLYNCYITGSLTLNDDAADESSATAYSKVGVAVGNGTCGTLKNIFWSEDASITSPYGAVTPSTAENCEARAYVNDAADEENETAQSAIDDLNLWVGENYDAAIGTGSYKWSVTEDRKPLFGGLPATPQAPVVSIEVSEAGFTAGQQLTDDDKLTASIAKNDSETGSGTLGYQWYQCDDVKGSNPTAVGNSLSNLSAADITASLMVSTDTPGRYYYYLQAVYTDDGAGGYDIDFSQAKSDIITVTVGYMINFSCGEMYTGQPVESIGPVLSGDKITLPEAPTERGYAFESWQQPEGSMDRLKYEAAATYLVDIPQSAGNSYSILFEANWKDAAKYDYTIDGGSAEKLLEDSSYEGVLYEKEVYTIPQATELFGQSDDYKFGGWNIILSDGSEAVDENGSILILQAGDTWSPEESFTLKAVWNRWHTVTYDAGARSSSGTTPVTGEVPEGGAFAAGDTVTLAEPGELAYENHSFKNWKAAWTITDESGSETQQTQYVSPGGTFTMPDADVVFTAQWVSLYRISFEKYTSGFAYGDQITGEAPEAVAGSPGSTFLIPDQGALALEGYVFTGWYDMDFGSVWKPGDTYSIYSEMTLSAVWKKKCVLTFTAGEGGSTGTPEDPEDPDASQDLQTIDAIEDETVALPESTFEPPANVTENGNEYFFKFAGWTDENGIVYKAGTPYVVGGDMTFTAKYDKIAVWDGGTAADFASGTGEKMYPYVIETASQLKKLSEDVANGNSYKNEYFILGADIDLNGNSWQPIGLHDVKDYLSTNGQYPFEGYFDGDGHTVSNFVIDQSDQSLGTSHVGLFGYVKSPDATKDSICNLNVSEGTIDFQPTGSDGSVQTDTFVGMIVGYLVGSMSGCTASGSISVTPKTRNNGVDTIAQGGIGGLIGYVSNGSVDGCQSDVDVKASHESKYVSGSGFYHGGIAGKSEGSTITDCENRGCIEAYYSAATYAHLDASGGIVGYAASGTDACSISDCRNYGDVAITGAHGMFVGGVCGRSEIAIADCVNQGTVTHHMTYYDGGVSSASGYYGGANAGGVAGFSSASIEKCSNTAAVTVYDDITVSGGAGGGSFQPAMICAGGIAGACYGGTLKDCYNTGTISTEFMDGKEGLDQYCYMIRDTGYVDIGGIAGIAGMNASDGHSFTTANHGQEISNVHNYGTVQFADAFSRGEDDTDHTAGLIVGRCAYQTKVSNAYYLSEEASEEEDSENSESGSISSGETNQKILTATEDGKLIPAAGVGNTAGMTAESNTTGATQNQFAIGEVAYLLDGGDGEPENAWTQGSELYPVLGTLRVNKVTAVQGAYTHVTLGKSGTSMDNESVYATSGETILINVTVSSDDREVVDSYTTSKSGDGGTWYYTYEVYEGPALYAIDVNYIQDGSVVAFENVYDAEQGGGGNSFVMAQSNDAKVITNYYEGKTTELVKSWFVADEELQPEPEPSTGSGGGKGGGNGVGTGTGTQPGNTSGSGNHPTDINPEINTGIPSTTNVPQTTLPNQTISDDVSQISIPVPAVAAEAVNQQEPEPVESIETPDSGGGETEEMEEEIVEEETPQEEDLTVFEVIQKTVEDNLFISLLLLLLILLLIVIGGYSRYRKSRNQRMFK